MNEQHSLAVFSFVKPAPNGTIESMWNVKPTGHFDTDMVQGQSYASEVLTEISARSPALIAQIAQAMPKEFSGLEHGFFHQISLRLMRTA